MEASTGTVPEKAMVLAVSKKMLYGEKPALVGVGLMYKSHYISPVSFSAAYVQLNIWHSAGSNEESEDKLTATRLLFVSISEMSDVVPVGLQHPILVDVESREAMECTGEPMWPLSFRGFRLHTAWTQQPGGELTRHVAFPCFLGEVNSSLLEYELEKFPQDLRQGQKRTLNLKPPSPDHWNIASDLTFPLALEESRWWREAKWAAQGLEERSEGSAPSPTKTSPHREQVLDTMQEILARVHTLRLQTMHKMGGVWELDRILAQTLLTEASRLHLIVGEDFTKSLIALRTDLEGSCEVLVSDIVKTLNLHTDDPVSGQVKGSLQKFQRDTSLKVNLPLMELEAAWEDMGEFLQSRLREISSQTESHELIEELARKMSAHASRVWELVQVPGLGDPEVSQ